MTDQRGTTNAALLERRQHAVPPGPFNVAPVFLERARGAWVQDVDGNEYVDFCGGIGTLNVGHNHPRVVGAIQAQAERLVHTCWHVAMYEPYLELAEKLNARVPIPGPCRTALFNSGAEGNENAVKIARHYTGRPAVIAFERGFHGRTLLGMTLTGKVHPYSAGFGPFAPEVYRLPYQPFFDPPVGASDREVSRDVQGALDRLFQYQVEPGSVACVLVEPVLGEGGFFPIHPVALDLLADRCRAEGIVVVSDEVQAGLGRCGSLFACERYGLEPDLAVMAKSLAGGLPLSAVTGRAAIMDAPHVGGLGGTFGGNPVACAAALAVLEVLDEEQLPERARVVGRKVMEVFERLVEQHDHLGRARGLGAMCGLEVVDPETGAPSPEITRSMVAAARERGLLIMAASGHVIRTLMPLNIPEDMLQQGLAALEDAAAAVAGGPTPTP